MLATYFGNGMAEKISGQAAPIIQQYGGVNLFSTAQYGRNFIEGDAYVYDIYDARITGNYAIFQQYAWDNFGLRAYYDRFAKAASQFIQDYDYDGILFYPDEFHAVLTNYNDTWIFLRDAPSDPAAYNIFYSQRVKNLKVSVTGGYKMSPMQSQNPLYSSSYMYYCPDLQTSYSDYTTQVPRTFTDTDENGYYARLTFGPSDYIPHSPSRQALANRKELGITASPLSNSSIRVGGWKAEDRTASMLANGITFVPNPGTMTWGGQGLYLLVLQKEYW